MEVPKGRLILNGCSVPTKFETSTMDEHGLEVKVGRGARRRRIKKVPIDLIVLHWTGGEGPAERVFRVLHRRRLGVEFVGDRESVCWQFADPVKVDTFDAGYVNRRSLGKEYVNYGVRKWYRNIPRKGRDRGTEIQTIHGRERRVGLFYPEQVQECVDFVELMCSELNIPRRIPKEYVDGKWQIISRTLSPDEMRTFSGVVGHFHVSRRKLDPGLQFFRALMQAGY